MLRWFRFVTLFFAISCTVYSSSSVIDIDYFMDELEDMTLEEAIEYLKSENQRFQEYVEFYINFFDRFHDEVKVYNKEEESYGEWPVFLSPEEMDSLYTDYLSKLELSQTFKYPDTRIRIDVDRFRVKEPGKLTLDLKEIFYSDSTSGNVEKEFFHTLSITPARAIDSVRMVAYYSIHTGFDSYPVKKTVEIPGGNIKINQIKGNKVEVELTGTARKYNRIIALNQEGKVLNSSSSGHRDKNSDKVAKQYAKAFSKFLKKVDDYKTIDELKDDYRKMLIKLPPFFTEDSRIYTGYFKGNVHSVVVYIPQQTIKKEVGFTVSNKDNFPELVLAVDNESEQYGFLNRSGEFVIAPEYPDLHPVNHFYYYREGQWEDGRTFYHLDIKKQQLVEMPDVDDIYDLHTGNVSVSKEGQKALVNANGEDLTGYIYDFIYAVEGTELLRVRKDWEHGFINTSGEIVVPLSKCYISQFSEGYALITRLSGDHTLIDGKGKVVLDLSEYEDAKEFSEGTLGVAKNGLWGFIDFEKNVVIPHMYDEVKPFFEGVTLVGKNGYYGLIDKTGKVIVPITSSNYFIIDNSGKRQYRLKKLYYDHTGKEIVKNRN